MGMATDITTQTTYSDCGEQRITVLAGGRIVGWATRWSTKGKFDVYYLGHGSEIGEQVGTLTATHAIEWLRSAASR